MIIGPHTRISELIKINEESIEAIASLAKPLRKLRNPLLRRVMAPRVTLSEAASIGGCTLEDFQQVLEPLGFTFIAKPVHAEGDSGASPDWPDWLQAAKPHQIDTFDVRAIIESGDDPLKEIMKRYQALPEGYVLCITNSFIPYPLINLLGKKGTDSFVQSEGEKLHHTWFFKNPTSLSYESEDGNVTMHDAEAFSVLLARFNTTRVRHIDVRDLPMPQPMETILEVLPTLDKGEVLLVDHKRVPMHLLEELQGSEYAIHIHEIGEGNVNVLIQPLAGN